MKKLWELLENRTVNENCLTDYLNKDDLKKAKNRMEYIRETLRDSDICTVNAEFVYYRDAIGFLKDNDPTLRQSLEIAGEYGFSSEDLDSCKLATLLIIRQNEDKLEKILEEVLEWID